MSKPSITSLHDRLQAAEIALSKLRQQLNEVQANQGAILVALLGTMRILWQVARLIQRESLCHEIAAAADTLKAATEPPRL